MDIDVEYTVQILHIISIHIKKPSLADLGGTSWRVLEVAGKVGQDLDGQGGKVKIVQTKRAARKSKAINANAIK